jgi:hypothetical protein
VFQVLEDAFNHRCTSSQCVSRCEVKARASWDAGNRRFVQ